MSDDTYDGYVGVFELLPDGSIQDICEDHGVRRRWPSRAAWDADRQGRAGTLVIHVPADRPPKRSDPT